MQDALDAFARATGMKSAEYLRDTARARRGMRAGDVAARAPRKVGPDFGGGMTALIYAAREGQMNAVKALVESGANINQVSGDKISPMVEAIINGHLDIAKYLLDHGADPNLATVSGLTALYATIDVQWAPKAWFPQPSTDQEKIGYLDLMNALIDKKADVNAPIGEKLWFRSFTNDYTWVDPAGATPFWRAAQSGDIAAMKLLVEHGADPKLADQSRRDSSARRGRNRLGLELDRALARSAGRSREVLRRAGQRRERRRQPRLHSRCTARPSSATTTW